MIVIGDVHGCFLTLKALIDKIPEEFASDDITLVGDLIDRGPRSKEVVDWCIQRNIYSVLGNHEKMLLDTLDDKPRALEHWMRNGGKQTLESYSADATNMEIPQSHEEYFRMMPAYRQDEGILVTHAGLSGPLLDRIDNLDDQSSVIWNRDPLIRYAAYQVHGHTPTAEPIVKDGFANIDTGCVFNGKLTAIHVQSKKVFTQRFID